MHTKKVYKNRCSSIVKLFNGELGLYPNRKIHIDGNADAHPKHMMQYYHDRVGGAGAKSQFL